ncbi:GntR family transcriptional regulator [Rhizobium leguminosarum]|uniref:GntR family transcriptional regulator n=1 Tax=Rhizobium leguminosarum TaxID=384 RepID=UPI0015C0ED76|nr:GntR family transcriptional regulator [Rhizobium leguminosarum]MBY5825819.1 GntR family transcriptional regulator [Rhizobium leguminosarum]
MSTTRKEKSGPISQTTTVLEAIRSDILHGVLAPGLKLKIELLQERYNCGATPIREALSLLSANGLVKRIENRGFRVALVSPEHCAEVIWTRCFVEERAIREAILHGGADWEEKIVVAQYRLLQESDRLDAEDEAFRQWEKAHEDFHVALISACPSKSLLRFCAQLYNESSRYRYIGRLGRVSRAGAYEEHTKIADAALKRDGELAASLLVEHYRRTGELLKAHLEVSDSKPALRPPLKSIK